MSRPPEEKTAESPYILWKIVNSQTFHSHIARSLGNILVLVQEAGKRILDVYGQKFEVFLKSDLSPLTLADQRSHEVLFEGLPRILDVPVLSEEGRTIEFAERSSWQTFWSADPLDGTKEFVRKSGDFCVSIGLVHDRSPLFGVIYIPVENRVYFGSMDLGGHTLSGDLIPALSGLPAVDVLARSQRLESNRASAEKEWVLIGSVSHGGEISPEVLKKLRKKHPFSVKSVGSAIKFCRIAEGAADFYPRVGTTMEWDTAGGQAIVESAGGGLISATTGQPLTYNKESLENPDFLCFGGRFAQEYPEMLSLSPGSQPSLSRSEPGG